MKKNDENKEKNLLVLIAAIVLVCGITAFGGITISRMIKAGSVEDVVETTTEVTEVTTEVAKVEKVTTEELVKSTKGNANTTTKGDAKSTKATKTTTEVPEPVTGGKADSTEASTELPRPVTEAPTEAPVTEAPTEEPEPVTEAPEPITEAPTEEPTTEHQHDWIDITETTTEKVKVKDAWDEQVEYYKCSYCGARATEVGEFHISECGEQYYSEKAHQWRYEGASWVSDWDVIHHDAVYKDKKVTKVVGQKCSTCGATK